MKSLQSNQISQPPQHNPADLDAESAEMTSNAKMADSPEREKLSFDADDVFEQKNNVEDEDNSTEHHILKNNSDNETENSNAEGGSAE